MNPSQKTDQFQFQGLLKERMDRAMARIHSHPYSPLFIRSDVSFEMPRIFTDYSGDISGRYIELMSIYGQMGNEVPELDSIVKQVVGFQKSEGYFGVDGFDPKAMTERETKIFWGNGRLLIGLMEYHEYRKSEQALEAAQKIADFFYSCRLHEKSREEFKKLEKDGGASGIATTWCSCIEGVVRLFEKTRNEKYAQLAKGMAQVLPTELDGFHSHGRLTALRGILDLALSLQDAPLLESVKRQWSRIHQNYLTPTGAVQEHFGHRLYYRDEGCSTADWVMLSLKLYSATGEPKYIEAAEQSLWNGLLPNQFENGGFGHQAFLLEKIAQSDEVVPVGIGLRFDRPRQDSVKEAYWCCSFHGPRALLEIGRSLVTSRSEGLDINLQASGDFKIGATDLKIKVDSSLRCTRVQVSTPNREKKKVRVRIPSWSKNLSIEINDRGTLRPLASYTDKSNEWITIDRTWNQEDELIITLNPKLEAKTVFAPEQHLNFPDREGIYYGPWMIGYDPSDDLLYSQGLSVESSHGEILTLEDLNPQEAEFPMKVIVRYEDLKNHKKIWTCRGLTPLHQRRGDHPLKTVFRNSPTSIQSLSYKQSALEALK